MSEKEIFKVYYHEIENEKEKYRVYYSYDARAKDAIEQLETMLKKKLYIYDIFPNFDEEKKKLTTPIAVITKSGQEMYLPVDLEMHFIGCSTVLFGYDSPGES